MFHTNSYEFIRTYMNSYELYLIKRRQTHMGKTQIVGIDLGNFNVKTSNKEMFRATWSLKADKLKATLPAGNKRTSIKTLEYMNKKYYIEQGEFDTHSEKSSKDTLPLYLYALSTMVKKNVTEVKAVVGLPIIQLETKDELVKKFKGSFTFKADGTLRTINVTDVRVFPECVAANYSIPNSVKMDYILLDLGGLSANKVLFHDGEYEKSDTEPTGILNLIEQIASAVNSDHILKLTTSQMYRHLDKNNLWTPKTGQIDLEPYREMYFDPYVKDVMDSLEALEGLNTPIYILGGAATMLKPYIDKYQAKNKGRYQVNYLDDAIFYNAIGFERVGKMTWPK